jgi:hypothetical protein
MPEPIGSAVATKVFGELLTAFAKKIATSVGERVYGALTRKGSSFEAHIKTTFERCTQIKTLLNRDEPVPLLSLYVNLRFRTGTKELDDYDVIEQLGTAKRIIISGSGGGGNPALQDRATSGI